MDSPTLVQLIPNAVMSTATKLNGKAVVEHNGQTIFVREIGRTDLLKEIAKLKNEKKSDFRLNFDVDATSGLKVRRFEEAVAMMGDVDQCSHWGVSEKHEGPRCTKEYVEGIVENGGEPEALDVSWRASLGLTEESRARHDSAFLHDLIKVGALRDGLNLKGLFCFERVCRRLRFIRSSQVRESVATSKAKFFLGATRDEYGGVRTLAFDQWVEERQVAQNKALKVEKGLRCRSGSSC